MQLIKPRTHVASALLTRDAFWMISSTRFCCTRRRHVDNLTFFVVSAVIILEQQK